MSLNLPKKLFEKSFFGIFKNFNNKKFFTFCFSGEPERFIPPEGEMSA